MPIERIQREGGPKRVLLIGWDAADWQMIDPLIEQGLMPTTAALLGRGAWGNLASLRPMLSPILWNTIATGKRPKDHGVYGFTEPDPDGRTVRPTTSTSRKCKALWNVLSQCGLRSNVVGWYASHPAEPIAGVMVSNQFEVFQSTEDDPDRLTPAPAQSVHPAEMTDRLAEFRVRPAEIDAGAIVPFIPNAAQLLDGDTRRLGNLQRMLAQTATVHAAATHLMTETEWDLTAVYYEGIDRFGHEFMEFHPPKMDQVSEEDFQAYQHCMNGIYRFHDMMLQTLLDLAGDDTAVVLISDHGYYNNHLRPDPREGKSGPVDWHRPFGVLAASGPGIRSDARLYGASLLDVAPTVLHLLGLPAGYDMPGRVLSEALDLADEPQRIETWEEIEGDAGMHPADLRVDPADAREAMQQLIALGYIDAPRDSDEKTVRDTIAHNRFALAQSLVEAGEHAEALAVARELDASLRETPTVQVFVAACLLATGETKEARDLLNSLLEAGADAPRLHLMLGTIAMAEGDSDTALAHYTKVAETSPRLPGLHTKLGGVYQSLGDHAAAVDAYERALAIDAESPAALSGLSQAKLALGAHEEALELAYTAAELIHHLPVAHLTIGQARLALGDDDGAIEALELCVRQAPRMQAAHLALAGVYHRRGETEKATQAELRAKRVLS